MKKRINIAITATVVTVFVSIFLPFNVFSNTYENPNVIIGPNSTMNNEYETGEKNYAFESFSEIMEKTDIYKTVAFISEYRKGNKEIIENLTNLILKYNDKDVQVILNYMLNDNYIKLLSAYTVNHIEDKLDYHSIKGLTMPENGDIIENGNKVWTKLKAYLPAEFLNNIDGVFLEMNKAEEDMMTICELNNTANKWAVYIDVRLLLDDYEEELFKQAVHNTVYYYTLRTDQIAFEKQKKDNYSYLSHIFLDESYINAFYRKYWKGKFKEINLGQIDIYPNTFVNNKASRTVYKDMAVSFYYYLGIEKPKNTTQIINEKIKFFNNYDTFRVLKNFFVAKYKDKIMKK